MKPFKVVCINGVWGFHSDGKPAPRYPVEGEIYTAVRIGDYYSKQGYYLAEFGEHDFWDTEQFRPVQDIGDSVETHIQELIKKEDLQTISV